MFFPHKSDVGFTQPWEYLPAVAGTYKPGQLLMLNNGQLKVLDSPSSDVPPYICQCSRTVVEGEIIPVIRTSDDVIYESRLDKDAPSAKIGSMLCVSKGGEAVNADATGSFEVVFIENTEKGSVVCGRFCSSSAASGAAAAAISVATDQEVSDALDEAGMKGD